MQKARKIIGFLLVLTIFISLVSAEANITIINNPITENVNFSDPQKVIIDYENNWILNSEQKIIINSIDYNNNSFFPRDILYKINDKEVQVKRTIKKDKVIEVTFAVSDYAKLGYNSLNVSIIDDKIIEKQLNYRIVEQDNKLVKYGIIGIIAGIGIVILIVGVLIDKIR